MIDGGTPRKARAFQKAMAKIPVRPDEIQLMVITPGHYDHAGSAGDIKEITGARIALRRLDKDWLQDGLVVLPSSVTTWGHIMRVMLEIFSPWLHLCATGVDVVLGDEGLSLAEYGIGGRVIHAPSHTPGSVSVLLETGDAFMGCLAMNELPLRLRPGLPIFAEDIQAVRKSWKLLLDQGPGPSTRRMGSHFQRILFQGSYHKSGSALSYSVILGDVLQGTSVCQNLK